MSGTEFRRILTMEVRLIKKGQVVPQYDGQGNVVELPIYGEQDYYVTSRTPNPPHGRYPVGTEEVFIEGADRGYGCFTTTTAFLDSLPAFRMQPVKG